MGDKISLPINQVISNIDTNWFSMILLIMFELNLMIILANYECYSLLIV